MSCPLQKAQPLGAKLPGKIRISATKGLAMRLLSRAREDAEERDDEIDAQVRLEVIVRLDSAGESDRGQCSCRGSRGRRGRASRPSELRRDVAPGSTRLRPRCDARNAWLCAGVWFTVRVTARRRRAPPAMKPLPEVERDAAAQIGKRERRLAVAAVSRADQREELRFRRCEELAFAEHPSRRGRSCPRTSGFRRGRLDMGSSSVRRREDALEGDRRS